MQTQSLAMLALSLCVLACPNSQQARPVPDTGTPVDARVATDARPADSSNPDRPMDAGVLDSRQSDGAPADAGRSDLSSGGDTTPGEVDAGLPPQGTNILAHGSFESWTAGLPDGWVGAENNLLTENIVEDSSRAHDGLRSAQLVNERSGHKRFTTAAMSVQAGRYHCSYWVRGSGEIRNARYSGSYSNYSSYTSIDSDNWQQLRYDFNVAADVDSVFELIFSIRNTGSARGHLSIDHVRCSRNIEACDAISCEIWQTCDNTLPGCVTASGFCASTQECHEWQDCDGQHLCTTAANRCAETQDCGGSTPVCNLGTHSCEAGDPCTGVTCDDWKECDPANSNCVLSSGRCLNTRDCTGTLPVCDIATHTCEAVDHTSNVVPNGGFEFWEDVWLWGPTTTTHHLPVSWYGVCDACSPYYPTSEISPGSVNPYTGSVHGGSTALQLIKSGQPGDRFVSEPFSITPGRTYSCSYRVRGQGTHRQRAYCGGWEPDTSYQPVDSDLWQAIDFEINATSSWCVLILYVSNTDAVRDHVQIDDVVCSKKFP